VPGHEVLFLAGLGRSGTTALFNVFSAHPQIVLGVERYKWLYLRNEVPIGPELFAPGRFFDFDDGATNITPAAGEVWAAHYERMRARWDSARYVGDKMVTIRAQRIWQTLPEARFVFIVRDPQEVAASWHARAGNAQDTAWGEDRDARRAVIAWNKAVHRIRRAVRQRPDHAVVLEFARFFGDPSGAGLTSALTWLGLERTPEIDAELTRAHQQFERDVAPKERALPPEDEAFVDEHADRDCWRDLVAMAL
jgi:hypothetical protein